MAELLLGYGADIDLQYQGEHKKLTLLMNAVKNHDLEMSEFLIKQRANVNCNPLSAAVMQNRLSIAEINDKEGVKNLY
jgi:hypothetical protein